MIIEEFKKIKSGRRELRKFGITVGVFLGLLVGWFLWREKDYYFYFLILSGVSFVLLSSRPSVHIPGHL